MNELEERLRAAFNARAATYESSPEAWARVRDHRPRHRRIPLRLVVAALPVALLAVFVPVLLNGGLGRGDTAAGADEVYQRLMRDRTLTGEQVTVDNPTEGRPLRLWFAKAALGYPELCFVMERAAAEPYGGCTGVAEAMSADAWFTGSTLRDGAETAMDWGVALGDVGGVTGVSADGQKFAGTVLRPAGAPYRIWTVTYPARHQMAGIEAADERGRSLGSRARDMMTVGSGEPSGAAMELPAGVFARPHRTEQGTELHWTRNGVTLDAIVIDEHLPVASAFPRGNVITGVARKDVAQVEIAFGDGPAVRAATRPDPWNLGVTVFAVENPAGERTEGYRLVAYDAAGAEVWRDDKAGRPMTEDVRPVGEVMTIPGTEGGGEPVRAWFGAVSKQMHTLCLSGGVPVEGWGGGTCTGGTPGAFTQQKAVKFLPEPGTVTYVGQAGTDWESVEAVFADGRRVPAAFVRGKGTPAPIWHVTVPNDGAVLAGFTMKAKDRPLERFPEYAKDCARGAARSDAARQTLAAGITAVVSEPSCMAFWQNGEIVPSLPGPLPKEKLSDLLTPERRVWWGRGTNTWYGYAPAGTAKVTVTTTDKATVTADAVPDRWNQGVTLFASETPAKADFSAGTVIVGYDAQGKELWRQD